MDRNQAKEFYPILQAYAEGKIIETRRKPTADNNGVTKDGWFEFNDWAEMKELEYWVNVDYRIKPEPNYRPFKNAEECWAEMYKHEPFGWLTSQNGEVNSLIIAIDNEGLIIGDRNNGVMGFTTATDLFKIKFADGVPFGVKVEE